ncbi:hypothetical protein CS063_10635 [Sporanaerobium hydrogeniformans]|uniref:Uncharacterized protein n=1 Tax=Sporanaerobium hydrogeniformans TaxID=3072179 RepID=A0AC61DBL8_9FIRM|nr:ATP-binding protein [Sporanaerobium hydrogeniformans]PHV70340.1 hypothetical protein CS063_10635 [Sporanaerobium hydrogeniformans]
MKKQIILPVITTICLIGLIICWETFILAFKLSKGGTINHLESSIYIQTIYKIIGVLIVAAIAIAWLLSRIIDQVIGPMKELRRDAASFRAGEYNHQLRYYSIEEVQALANALDNMGDELNGTIRRLKHQINKAESVLAALDEGMVVMDTEGYVTEVNAMASELLNLRIAKYYKNHVTTIIRQEKLKRLIDNAVTAKKYDGMEITLGEKIVYATILPVGEGERVDEYLLILRDITQIKALEEVKYQFVTNVSHELKTPLTSIQGFIETLKDGAIEDKVVAMRFLNIIDIEARRLYRLIQDILLLSEIENRERREVGDVVVEDAIRHVLNMVSEQAQAKGLQLVYKQTEPIILKQMSEDHFKQLLLNLITNGIKYTDQGEVSVEAFLERGSYILRIKDTGIGIPKESMNHIFERFYRVDKSRSRKSGGTGLGLSIVKHIAQLYNAKIEVESEEGKGTCFTLTFK